MLKSTYCAVLFYLFLFLSPLAQSQEIIVFPIAGLPANATPLELVLIPAGSFLMGTTTETALYYYEDEYLHPVTISRNFYMGRYEVTQAQFVAVMGFNPSKSSIRRLPNLPVERVGWIDGLTFCNRLSKMGGLQPVYDETTWIPDYSANGFRLPTEAEWEYACRAGTDTLFYWGDDPPQYVDYEDYIESNPNTKSLDRPQCDLYIIEIDKYAWTGRNTKCEPMEVGLKLPNAWGLFDMAGNIWERCSDNYDPQYGLTSSELLIPQIDPKGYDPTPIPRKGIFRGGGYDSDPDKCRSAARWVMYPPKVEFYNADREYIGMRIVRFANEQSSVPGWRENP